MNVRAVAVDGAELSYVEVGSGPPVVFVHGSLDDYRSWRLQMEPFAAQYRVIAYSRRYHYPNPWTGDAGDYSAHQHAGDLAVLIRTLAGGPVHLVTSSYGGDVGLFMTAQHPELVRSLVVAEPPLLPWLDDIPGGRALRDEFLQNAWLPARAAFEADKLEEGARLFLDGVMGRPTFQHLGRRGYQMIMDNAPEMKAEVLSATFFPPFGPEDARRLRLPVLLCKSEFGPTMFHLISDRLEECLPDARSITVPNASHAMHVGNPAFYNARVLEFLAGIPA